MSFNDPKLPYPYILPQPDLPPKTGGIWRQGTFYTSVSFDPTVSTAYGPHMITDTEVAPV